MARQPYIPFDEAFEEIFARCGFGDQWTTVSGDNKGWSLDTFNSIVDSARDYLNALFDDDDDSNGPPDEWFDLLESPLNIVYWSTEGTHVG